MTSLSGQTCPFPSHGQHQAPNTSPDTPAAQPTYMNCFSQVLHRVPPPISLLPPPRLKSDRVGHVVIRMDTWNPQPRVQTQQQSSQQGLLKPALSCPRLKKETQETHLTTLQTICPPVAFQRLDNNTGHPYKQFQNQNQHLYLETAERMEALIECPLGHYFRSKWSGRGKLCI